MASIAIIAALGTTTHVIGKNNTLLWHIPDDLKRFKELTLGHSVIMGRKTWESLPQKFRPLPRRTNIVVTRQAGYRAEDATVVGGLPEAFLVAQDAPGADEIFIIGGAQIYAESLAYANRLYLTLVEDDKEGDVFFPSYEQDFKIMKEENGAGIPPHRFQVLERK